MGRQYRLQRDHLYYQRVSIMARTPKFVYGGTSASRKRIPLHIIYEGEDDVPDNVVYYEDGDFVYYDDGDYVTYE